MGQDGTRVISDGGDFGSCVKACRLHVYIPRSTGTGQSEACWADELVTGQDGWVQGPGVVAIVFTSKRCGLWPRLLACIAIVNSGGLISVVAFASLVRVCVCVRACVRA